LISLTLQVRVSPWNANVPYVFSVVSNHVLSLRCVLSAGFSTCMYSGGCPPKRCHTSWPEMMLNWPALDGLESSAFGAEVAVGAACR
jgi:hypothetical protein